MANYIDAHCHLCASDFDKDREDVIKRAKEMGMQSALVVAEFSSEFKKIMELSEIYKGFCIPCLGIHPVQQTSDGDNRSVTQEDLDVAVPFIESHRNKIVAVGECGLDFTPYYIKKDDDKEIQRKVFARQIAMAKEYDVPVNVHSRSAGRPAIELLKQEGAEKVLLHAFSGKASVAMQGVQCGYYFSFPPSIIHSEQKKKVIERIPLDSILLETDSPALGPEKQGRNEPCNIQISCEYIAKVKKTDVETVQKIARENTLKLFPRIYHYINQT